MLNKASKVVKNNQEKLKTFLKATRKIMLNGNVAQFFSFS
jgi:hypothetical protein